MGKDHRSDSRHLQHRLIRYDMFSLSVHSSLITSY